jgi:hypothetical protein
LSNKWHKANQDKKEPQDHQKPTYHQEIKWPPVYPVRIEKSSDDDKRYTDQQENWGRQLRLSRWLNWITVGAAAVGLFGLFYLYGQLGEMRVANKITRDSLNVSQRAWVTPGRKDGTVAEFIVPKDPKQNAELILYFQNSGHIPATLAWGTGIFPTMIAGGQTSGITYEPHPFKGIIRMKNRKQGNISEPGETASVAGDSIFRAKIGDIPQPRLTELKKSSLVMSIRYEYCDELGSDMWRELLIEYRNSAAADLDFRLMKDLPTFYFPHPPNAEWEYMPPCETTAEREQEQKKAAQPKWDCRIIHPWPCKTAN